MIFTSYTYLAFLAVAFLLHWLLPVRARTWLLIAFSYLFYCSWKWQYGFLLLAVSVFTFVFGRLLHARQGDARLLTLGIAVELLPLLYFKYADFLLDNTAGIARTVGFDWRPGPLNILLPLGISFFTFQGIAYLVDIATGEEPFEQFRDFLLFKAFWPQLIAGPIIRPGEIRDQIVIPRSLDYEDLAEGARRIAHGFFKKVVLADTLGPYVDSVFVLGARPALVDTAAGVVGFGLQIYFDFSAYSDIAIGSARLFGFRFPENFDLPYSASSPQDFWNRWHQSLSRWIRDYVFTPLSFATRRSPRAAPVWLLLAMVLCGLWHGAAWTFVAWGAWHGALLVANQTVLKRLFSGGPGAAPWRRYVAATSTFLLVTLGWILFRSRTLSQAGDLLASLFTLRGGLRPSVLRENAVLIIGVVFLGLMLFQVSGRFRERAGTWLRGTTLLPRVLTAAAYSLMIVAAVIFDREARAFVYFQF
jgi:alginate O-acetyltransferase complex protein AlgI